MASSDTVADMLTRIRNAGKAKFTSVDIPGSNLKCEMARILKDEGYIRNYKFIKDNKQGILRVYLKYTDEGLHAIYGIERVSKPSRRTYAKSTEVKPMLNGLGVRILSTSKGVMSDRQARREHMGGEILCNVW